MVEETDGDDPLTLAERRWLHDKYEKLAEHEAQLADYRSSYFAVLNTALIAGLVLIVINLLRNPPLFLAGASMLGLFGAGMSGIWALVLHRTIAAQNLWRDAALALETDFPPLESPLVTQVPGGQPGTSISIDLTRPYHAHRLRFSREHGATFFDAIQPGHVWSGIPLVFCVGWLTVMVAVWAWYVISIGL